MHFERTDLAILNANDLTVKSISSVNFGSKINWGSWVMQEGEYLYIYGSDDTGSSNKFIHLARTKIADITTQWEYFTANGWQKDPTASKPIFNEAPNQFSVIKKNGNYYLFAQEDFFSRKIYKMQSVKPEGPFTQKTFLYETPVIGTNSWTYNAKAHPEYNMDTEGLLISYDHNTLDFEVIYQR